MVLAERDKTEMDRELRRELGKASALEWPPRSGAPHSIADLERVGAGQARTIILMHPEVGVSNEARRPCRPSSVFNFAEAKCTRKQGLPFIVAREGWDVSCMLMWCAASTSRAAIVLGANVQ